MALRRRTGKRARWLVDLRNMAPCDIAGCMCVSKGHTIHSTDQADRNEPKGTETTSPSIETLPTEQIDWLFTFGGNHTHPETGESLGNSFVRIYGTEAAARAVMVAAFGQRWAFQYDSAEQAGVAKYDLTEIALPASVS